MLPQVSVFPLQLLSALLQLQPPVILQCAVQSRLG